jgi:hypothetical protein
VVVSALQYVLRALPDQPAAVGSANELFWVTRPNVGIERMSVGQDE